MAHTQTQKVARAAHAAVLARAGSKTKDKYLSFARAFPTLIHTGGLAQASAFALAKKGEQLQVLDDVAEVLRTAKRYAETDGGALHHKAITAEVPEYLRMTRDALSVATWLKRYAEALLDADEPSPPGGRS